MIDFERTFDNAAAGYDRIRPVYPEELYRDIFRYRNVDKKSSVLEIGVGTGKATRPFLDTCCRFTGIEPGENLAAAATEKYRHYSNFSLYVQTLQEYVCPPEAFDLIYAATAFHWIPEEYGYKRVFELLKSGGAFARFAYHAGPDMKRPELAEEIQVLYERYMPQPRKPAAFSADNARALSGIAEKYGFVNTEYKLYRTTKDFSADEYLQLLHTYPNHMALDVESREGLFQGIHSAIIRNGGVMTVYYTMDLELAMKP